MMSVSPPLLVADHGVGAVSATRCRSKIEAPVTSSDRHGQDEGREPERDDDGLPAAREQLAAYFAGELTVFDLPLDLRGTDFQRRVWAALREIPYGRTRTYGELATALGAPSASRAVGLANGRNPISIVVPCHRVVGASGSLTGYAGGVDRKRALLDLEACRPAVGP